MESWKKRGIELLISATLSGNVRSVIPHYPQKTGLSGEETDDLERALPEECGISSRRLMDMLCELESDPRCNIHNLMIIKDGKVICECSAPAFSTACAHLAYSMSKSVVAMAAGLLFDDGVLSPDTLISDIFPEYDIDPAFAGLRLYHLLTMTSGASFNEIGSVTEERWSEAFLRSAPMYRVGSRFFYNSMNSYMIAAVVKKVSGVGVCEFLEKRIFEPLGIKEYFWELSPEGIEKGGWGLYISAVALAKLALVFMNDGEYRDKRIISSEWIEEATGARVRTGAFSGEYDYGYQMWVGRKTGDVLFNGMFGQNVWICRRNGIAAVVQAGNNELFQDSPTLEIITKYLGCDICDETDRANSDILRAREREFMRSRVSVKTLEAHRGPLYALGILDAEPYDHRWDAILGKYALPKNNGGLLPLITRIMQNSLDSSLCEITLLREAGRLFLEARSETDACRLEVGLYGYAESVLKLMGEVYLVRAAGEVEICADGTLTFRIELIYPELPSSVTLRLKKTLSDRIAIEMRETPDHTSADTMIRRIRGESTIAELLLKIPSATAGRIRDRLAGSFAPVYIGADTSIEGYEKIVHDEENVGRAEGRVSRALVRAASKYLGMQDASPRRRIDTKEKIIDPKKHRSKKQKKARLKKHN